MRARSNHSSGDDERLPAQGGRSLNVKRIWISIAVIVVLLTLAGYGFHKYAEGFDSPLEAKILTAALKALTTGKNAQNAAVATAIVDNFKQLRRYARFWSGSYTGLTLAAAIFSALAGVILKWESFPNSEKRKKDIAAACGFLGALLITASTTLLVQEKWQATRQSSAAMERLGYRLAGDPDPDPEKYYAEIANIIYARESAIFGDDDKAGNNEGEGRQPKEVTSPAAPGE